MQEVEVDFCSKSAAHQRILRTAVEKWLVPKGSCVQRLHLRYDDTPLLQMLSALQQDTVDVLSARLTLLSSLYRNSSADPTHSFSRDGSSLNSILQGVCGSLTSLRVTNCNDIFVGSAFEQLSTLSQLSKLHITAVRTRFRPDSFQSLSCLKHLKVGNFYVSFQVHCCNSSQSHTVSLFPQLVQMHSEMHCAISHLHVFPVVYEV